jgi:hypothetical protein
MTSISRTMTVSEGPRSSVVAVVVLLMGAAALAQKRLAGMGDSENGGTSAE